MDTKDKKILEILKENSRLTTREIAKKTLIPITTIHHRIKKLKELGIIKKYTVDLDYNKLGKSLTTIVLINIDYKILKKENIKQKDLALKIKSLEPIEKTFHVTGVIDMVVVIRIRDTTELESFLDKLKKDYDCIDKTQTLVVLNEI